MPQYGKVLPPRGSTPKSLSACAALQLHPSASDGLPTSQYFGQSPALKHRVLRRTSKARMSSVGSSISEEAAAAAGSAGPAHHGDAALVGGDDGDVALPDGAALLVEHQDLCLAVGLALDVDGVRVDHQGVRVVIMP